MNLIAASRPVDAYVPIIIILILAVIAGYWLIKMKRLSQVLLTLSGLGAILCVIEGISLLSRSYQTPSVAGAILLAVGLWIMAAIGLALRNTEDQ